MSYGFGMIFFEARNKLEAFEKAEQFAAELLTPAAANELIADNIRYFRNTVACKSEDEVERVTAYYLDGWLSRLFTIKCTYWPQYNLLGILGVDWPKKCLALAAGGVYFQNSADQDYDYAEWPSLPFFLDRAEIYKNMPVSEIIKQKAVLDDESYEDVCDSFCKNEEYVGYSRRSLLYQQIFEDLNLKNWLYGPNVNTFHRFAMSAIANPDDAPKLYARARHILLLGMQKGKDDCNG